MSCALDVNVKMVSWSPEDEGVLRLLRLLIITITSIVSVLLVVKELKRTVIRRVECLKWAGWHAALANWNFWGGHWYVTSAYGLSRHMCVF